MGRVVGVLLVLAVFVPFFAAADQVDVARRHQIAALLATEHPGVTMHALCRPEAEDCGDQGD